MKKAILIIPLLLIGGGVSVSASTNECHGYANSDTMRLACYDHATGFVAQQKEFEASSADIATPTSPPPKSSKWIISSYVSDLDDSKNVTLMLESNDNIKGRFGTPGPMEIIISCRENTTRMYFLFNDLHMSDYQYGTVTYRLDDNKASKRRMKESTDNKALGLWSGRSAIPFIKNMLNHDNLLIRATPYGDSAVTANFTISGLEEAIRPLRTACHW